MYTSTVYNLCGLTSRLDDLTAQFVNTVGDTNSNQTGNSTNLLVKVNQMETRLGDLTHQYEELKNDSRISDLMILEDKLITMEANLQNLTIDTNYTHLQIVSDDVTNMKKVLKNLTVNEFNQSRKCRLYKLKL
jgi:proline dehydrogenase